MGGTGISESIMFSAAIILAIAFVGVFAAVIIDAGADLDTQSARIGDGLRTEVIILNDPGAVASPLVLYVKNTGQTSLTTNATTILLDGVASQNLTADVLDATDDDAWPPGATVVFTASDLTFTAGEHHARVITEKGIEANLIFQA